MWNNRCGTIHFIIISANFFDCQFSCSLKNKENCIKKGSPTRTREKKTSHLFIYMNGMGNFSSIYSSFLQFTDFQPLLVPIPFIRVVLYLLFSLHSLRTAKRTIIITHSRRFTRLEKDYQFGLQHFFFVLSHQKPEIQKFTIWCLVSDPIVKMSSHYQKFVTQCHHMYEHRCIVINL